MYYFNSELLRNYRNLPVFAEAFVKELEDGEVKKQLRMPLCCWEETSLPWNERKFLPLEVEVGLLDHSL